MSQRYFFTVQTLARQRDSKTRKKKKQRKNNKKQKKKQKKKNTKKERQIISVPTMYSRGCLANAQGFADFFAELRAEKASTSSSPLSFANYLHILCSD